MRKNTLGMIFLVLSLVFLLAPTSLTITGNVILENFHFGFSYFYIIGIIFLFSSMIIFVSRQTLDAIIIPTSPSHEEDIERAGKAGKEEDKLKDEGYFLISGYVPKEKGKRLYKGSQTQDIYRELRKHGIKPSEIKIEPKARNTIENVIYSLEEIKKRGGKDIGIVSYPGHLDRFEDIIRQAKEEGLVDRKFDIHRMPTRYKETQKEKAYEFLSRILNRYKLRHGVEEALKSEDDPLVKFVKKAKDYLLNLVPKK
ncbi:MAG: YdcF family protein [Nanoarchaeota archaeon]|nr:YdcF family protein [Nanoarchaeota archaeon]